MHEFHLATVELFDAMLISAYNLLLPISVGQALYFLKKTHRYVDIVDLNMIIEMVLFVCTVKWIFDFYEHQHYNPDNLFML